MMPDTTALGAFAVLLRTIEWVLVPFVLLLIFGYGFLVLPSEPTDDGAKSSARAARWAGMLVLVLFVVSRKNRGDSLTLAIPSYDFSWFYSSLGVIGGFSLSPG